MLLVSQGPVTYTALVGGKHRTALLMTKYCGMFVKGSNTTPNSFGFPVSACYTYERTHSLVPLKKRHMINSVQ